MKKNTFIVSGLLLLHTIVGCAVEKQGIPTGSTTSPAYSEPSKQMLQDFEQYVQKSMKEWSVPGMAIGIVQGDKVVYINGFGVKRYGGDNE